ncbi:hypothetical protein MGLY_21150 [Neomoorella glycerini]|uniref:Uncharacterized protein n=1 Tax=Neomoorella glycerini TaxID=55779 RepID=A0A6I5ZSL6_9FIRM|nr:hypothetical protein MGLY_21150 [Moorella glycerini]
MLWKFARRRGINLLTSKLRTLIYECKSGVCYRRMERHKAQRPGQLGHRRAPFPAPDCRRRAGDGDPPGDDPLLYDHPRGGAAGHPGRRPGPNATSHERIFIARPEEFEAAGLERFLWLVSQPGWRADMAGVEELLRLVLPGFRVEKGREMVQVG